jgi:hypothetical protein
LCTGGRGGFEKEEGEELRRRRRKGGRRGHYSLFHFMEACQRDLCADDQVEHRNN